MVVSRIVEDLSVSAKPVMQVAIVDPIHLELILLGLPIRIGVGVVSIQDRCKDPVLAVSQLDALTVQGMGISVVSAHSLERMDR